MNRRLMKIGYFLCICLGVLFGYWISKIRMGDLTQIPNPPVSANPLGSFSGFYLSEYAAFTRFLDSGEVSDEVRIFSSEKDQFALVNDLELFRICPPKLNFYTDPAFVFWAARTQFVPDLDGDQRPEILAASYVGSAADIHKGRGFSATIYSREISKSSGALHLLESGKAFLPKHIQLYGYQTLIADNDKDFIGYGYNTGDIGAGFGRQIPIGGKMYSLSDGKLSEVDILKNSEGWPLDSIFLRSTDRTFLVSIQGSQILFYEWNSSRSEVEKINSVEIVSQEAPLDEGAPFKLFPLSDLNSDGTEDFAVKRVDSLDIFLSSNGAREWTSKKVVGLEPGAALIGGIADYDSDGLQDFWVTQPQRHGPSVDGKKEFGWAGLVLARELKGGSKYYKLSDILHFKIVGSSRYSDYDGIGTTLSLYSGDTDGDGIPDFSISGHRHLNEAGALFFVRGKDIVKGGVVSVTDSKVAKVRGQILGQLAAPYFHHDSSDWNNDGFDDVVVNSDNDSCSGVHAGAVYVLDGKKIWARSK